MIIFHDVLQGTPEWLKKRKNLWTGSKALRLLQGKSLPPETDFQGNKHTKRGQVLETIAIMEYERLVGRKVQRPGFVTNTVYPNAGYSPDGIDRRYLLEVKALNGERHEKLAAGDIPLVYLVQIYFGMIITGLRKAKLLVYNPEYEVALTIIEIDYEKAIGNNIRRLLKLDMKNRKSI